MSYPIGEELLTAVRAAIQGTSFRIRPAVGGFVVEYVVPVHHPDYQQRMRHYVLVDEIRRTITVTDERLETEWDDGYGFALKRGAFYTAKWSVGPDGVTREPVAEWRRGRQLIQDSARALGWQVRLPWEARVGLAAGIAALLALAITVPYLMFYP